MVSLIKEIAGKVMSDGSSDKLRIQSSAPLQFVPWDATNEKEHLAGKVQLRQDREWSGQDRGVYLTLERLPLTPLFEVSDCCTRKIKV